MVSRIIVLSIVLSPLCLCGCRMGVPMYVWQEPVLESTVGKKILVGDITGDTELAEKIRDQLIENVPQESGRSTIMQATSDLADDSKIQLATATATTDQHENDLVLTTLARENDYDYTLRGEILKDRGHRLIVGTNRLIVSWRLVAMDDMRSAGGTPVVVDQKSLLEKYPDLSLVGEEEGILRAGLVRETFRLMTPSVERENVQIATPYFLPYSREIRKGNIAAYNGHWADAEKIWSAVAEKSKRAAALHNLALAAVAAQDYSKAKQLAREAIRRRPSKLHKSTLVWIEQRQREYHKAFNLPDPPEGWFVTTR